MTTEKNKKQSNLIATLSNSNKGIGGPDKDHIKKFLKKPNKTSMFSKGLKANQS